MQNFFHKQLFLLTKIFSYILYKTYCCRARSYLYFASFGDGFSAAVTERMSFPIGRYPGSDEENLFATPLQQ